MPARGVALLVRIVALAGVAGPLAAQQPGAPAATPDTTKRDTARTLPPIEVVGSIRPAVKLDAVLSNDAIAIGAEGGFRRVHDIAKRAGHGFQRMALMNDAMKHFGLLVLLPSQ